MTLLYFECKSVCVGVGGGGLSKLQVSYMSNLAEIRLSKSLSAPDWRYRAENDFGSLISMKLASVLLNIL